ncbi:hypothetical protein ACFORF_04605, partial [Streptococcus caprae]
FVNLLPFLAMRKEPPYKNSIVLFILSIIRGSFHCEAIIEMKKCIAAMKLAGSNHLAKIYEGHLEKVLAEND